MRTVYKPFRIKKLNKRLTNLLKNSFKNPPVAPVEKLKKEAAEFEKMMRFRRIKYIERTPERVRRTVEYLTDDILKYSDGLISPEEAENLAYRCVANMDFNDKIQMHRNYSDYAEGIVDKYMKAVNNPVNQKKKQPCIPKGFICSKKKKQTCESKGFVPSNEIRAWVNKHLNAGCISHATAGEQFEYVFLPTGIVECQTVKCLICKKEYTDYV